MIISIQVEFFLNYRTHLTWDMWPRKRHPIWSENSWYSRKATEDREWSEEVFSNPKRQLIVEMSTDLLLLETLENLSWFTTSTARHRYKQGMSAKTTVCKFGQFRPRKYASIAYYISSFNSLLYKIISVYTDVMRIASLPLWKNGGEGTSTLRLGCVEQTTWIFFFFMLQYLVTSR